MLGPLSFLCGCVGGGLLALRLLSGRFARKVADEMARAAGFESLEKLGLYDDEIKESLAKFKAYRAVIEAKAERLEAENEALWSEVLVDHSGDGWNLYLITDSELTDVIFESEAEAREAFRRSKGLKEAEPCRSDPK